LLDDKVAHSDRSRLNLYFDQSKDEKTYRAPQPRSRKIISCGRGNHQEDLAIGCLDQPELDAMMCYNGKEETHDLSSSELQSSECLGGEEMIFIKIVLLLCQI
jgi:hypothetical protein